MPVQNTNPAALLDQLLTDQVSTNGTFYVAEIVGESRKWGLEREFVTDKNSPYSLSTADFREGGVYELKADDVGVRVYFVWTEEGGDNDIDIQVLHEGDNVDDDMILEAVESDDAVSVSVRTRVHDLVDEAEDGEALELVAAMLGDEADSMDPGAATEVDLGELPTHVRKRAKLFERAFSVAFERQTDQEPGVHLRAAALDAGVLAERKRGGE